MKPIVNSTLTGVVADPRDDSISTNLGGRECLRRSVATALGGCASAIALPEWSLRRKLALALTIPMLLAATFGGLRVHTELSQSDNYSATAKQITVLRPAAGYLAAAERAIIISRQRPALDDPGRVSAIAAVDVAGQRLEDIGKKADLTSAQRKRLDSVHEPERAAARRPALRLRGPGGLPGPPAPARRDQADRRDRRRAARARGQAAALQQALDGRVSLAMQQYMVNVADPKSINLVDLSAELGVEQVIIDRLGSILGTTDPAVQKLNQQNAAHFGVIRGGGHDLGDAEAFEAYDDLSVELLDDIDKDLTSAANDARGLAIANAVVTIALLLAAIFLALLVSRMLLNPIRRVREGALEVANTRLPEMVAKIRAGDDPGEIVHDPGRHTHEEMGQLARAVDDLHRQAVHLASGEAKLRSQVGEMFSTLSRRNTSLINQQLGLIERLEKDEEDPNRLESLFRLDHLASRMRRTADSLMVLADAPDADQRHTTRSPSATSSRRPWPVCRSTSASRSSPRRREKVNGAAAADVVHLMTELVDNALAFSPPTAPVKISTKQAGDSTIVEISDGGLGIAQDVLNSLNEDLRSGGEVTVETARRMGLLVVSRLATRHGITVSLARNPRGGTTATVLLPPALLRGRPTQVQPKQRPGPGRAQASAKSVLPAAVTERLSNEARAEAAADPSRAGRPGRPGQPGRSSAPAAFASRPRGCPDGPVCPPAAAGAAQLRRGEGRPDAPRPPRSGVDSIAAAINAVTAAARSARPAPPAPVAPCRVRRSARPEARCSSGCTGQRHRAARAADLPQREPATPTAAFDAIDRRCGRRRGRAEPRPGPRAGRGAGACEEPWSPSGTEAPVRGARAAEA